MDITTLQNNLYKLGYLLQTQISGAYDLNTKNAIKQFQVERGIVSDGIPDGSTTDAINLEITKLDGGELFIPTTNENGDSTYSGVFYEDNKNKPFFERTGTFRKNNVDIRIEYGPNKAFQTTITGVRFRSAGRELDGSGNPIYEVIEFIGRDIKEDK